jgi:hypothetical protein
VDTAEACITVAELTGMALTGHPVAPRRSPS